LGTPEPSHHRHRGAGVARGQNDRTAEQPSFSDIAEDGSDRAPFRSEPRHFARGTVDTINRRRVDELRLSSRHAGDVRGGGDRAILVRFAQPADACSSPGGREMGVRIALGGARLQVVASLSRALDVWRAAPPSDLR